MAPGGPGYGPAMSDIREADATAADLLVGGSWAKLKNGRILLTGATGFLGGALVETFLEANERLGLEARVSVLTRDARAALARHPWLADKAVELVGGDITNFEAPTGGFTHCIHGAAVPDALEDPSRVIVEGTRRCLDAAALAGVREFLFVSSGAVYGPQPADVPALAEDSGLATLGSSPRDQYARAKREAEELCLGASGAVRPRIARCFTFMGPGIPLETRYAAGNFIRDALGGGPIRVEGDGAAVRSYLYTADAAAWLWTILLSGADGGIYNVGSSDAVTISELAGEIARSAGGLRVVKEGRASAGSAQRYVPSVARAAAEMGLRPSVPLAEAIRRTLSWAKSAGVPARAS